MPTADGPGGQPDGALRLEDAKGCIVAARHRGRNPSCRARPLLHQPRHDRYIGQPPVTRTPSIRASWPAPAPPAHSWTSDASADRSVATSSGATRAAQIPFDTPVATAQGQTLTISRAAVITDQRARTARIVQADIPASNGVAHLIDRVVLPP